MRIGLLDCFSGVSGDMWVGALLDAGLPLAALEEVVARLGLPGVRVRREAVLRAGLAGTRFVVEVHGREPGRALDDALHGAPSAGGPVLRPLAAGPLVQPAAAAAAHEHRRLRDIERIVDGARLPDPVRERCLQVFLAIADVEARAHATTRDDVHFHEVGAVDTIVDIVCACYGTHALGIERLYASAVAVGSGTVRAAHGVLPVPAPATLELLFGVPVRHGGLAGERTTPTGAALLRALVHEFEPQLSWVPDARGYGAGTRDDPAVPNLLRLQLGTLRAPSSPTAVDELQCQLDTATGEQIGWLLDEALSRGAVDAFAQPVQMKKGRPGWLLTVLVDPGRAEALTTMLLEESSTLGVRRHRVDRAVLERWQERRDTALGAVVFKCARLPSGAAVARPEDDEVRRLCGELGIGRAEVLRRLQG
ncbi:MAG: nickel pincer cofactor biosynthesis protein LarC [Planctomycetota bacterium]